MNTVILNGDGPTTELAKNDWGMKQAGYEI